MSTVPDWQQDSDLIVQVITSGDFDDYATAELAVVRLFVPDLEFSRAGISHALTRLKAHYEDQRH